MHEWMRYFCNSYEGAGYNININMMFGDGDFAIVQILTKVILPLLRTYMPDTIIVPLGFDALGV